MPTNAASMYVQSIKYSNIIIAEETSFNADPVLTKSIKRHGSQCLRRRSLPSKPGTNDKFEMQNDQKSTCTKRRQRTNSAPVTRRPSVLVSKTVNINIEENGETCVRHCQNIGSDASNNNNLCAVDKILLDHVSVNIATPTTSTEKELTVNPRVNLSDNLSSPPSCSLEQIEDYKPLCGVEMVCFYNLWKRSPRKLPLRRGLKDLPNGFLRQSVYRECGCQTRCQLASIG